MGRTAQSKLDEADRLHTTATRLRKADPENAEKLEGLARRKRRSAIRQLSRPVRKRKAGESGSGRSVDIGT